MTKIGIQKLIFIPTALAKRLKALSMASGLKQTQIIIRAIENYLNKCAPIKIKTDEQRQEAQEK